MATISELKYVTQEFKAANNEAVQLLDTFNKLNSAALLDENQIKASQAEIAKATQRAEELRQKVEDTKDSFAIISKDKGFERLGASFGQFASKLKDLDFEGLKNVSKEMNAASKATSIFSKEGLGNAGKAIKDITGSFATLGKVLLTNPIFLLASIIGAIISNFEKLKNAGGLVGKVFSAIGDSVNFIIEKVKELLDWLGLTNFKEQELAQKTAKAAEKRGAAYEKEYDRQIAAAQAAGKSTVELEINKQLALQETFKERQKFLEQEKESAGISKARSKEIEEELDNLAEQIKDSENAITVIRNTSERERQDKANEAANRIKENEQSVKEFITNVDNEIRKSKLDAQGQEIFDLELKYQKEFELAGKNAQLKAQLEKSFEIQKQAIVDKYLNIEAEKKRAAAEQANLDRIAAEDRYFQLINELNVTQQQKEIDEVNARYDALFAAAEAAGQSTAGLIEQQQAEINGIVQKYRDKDKEKKLEYNNSLISAEQNLADAKISIASSAVAIAGELGKKSRKVQDAVFIAEKAFAIARIVVDTQREIAGIAAANAVLGPAGIPITAAQVSAAKIRAGIGIATIAATTIGKFIGGGGGGAAAGGSGSGGGAPSVSGGISSATQATPSFSLFGQGNNQNNVNASGESNNPQNITVRAVVSETEITDTQNYMNKVRQSAVL